jgi:hypothetical protein
LVTVLGLGLAAASSEERYSASSPVPRTSEPLLLPPGGRYCGRAAAFPFRLDGVRLSLVTGGAAGPPLRVTALSQDRRLLGSGLVAPGYRASGYPNSTLAFATLGSLPSGTKTTICVANAGHRAVALYAGRAAWGRGDPGLTAVEIRRDPPSLLAAVPDVTRRAALFHPAFLGVPALWIALVALVVALPALLSVAVAAAMKSR